MTNTISQQINKTLAAMQAERASRQPAIDAAQREARAELCERYGDAYVAQLTARR